MRWIVDENVAGMLIRSLRERGHDVLSVRESLPGAADSDILARARTDGRVVVTHDKDFGELAFRFGLPATSGIVLLRLSGSNPETDNRRVMEVLESRTDWNNQFAVVTDDRIRIRLLPRKHEKPR